MEDLFSTNIWVNNHNINYRVIFDKEQYVFLSEEKDIEVSSFSFKRKHDEWLSQQLLPEELKRQAIKALESYLLK